MNAWARLAWSLAAAKVLLISDAFRAVYGDDAMPPNANATVRTLIEFQTGDDQATGSTQLRFLDSFFNNSDGVTHVSAPHPVNYFFWDGGGATYYTSLTDRILNLATSLFQAVPAIDAATATMLLTAAHCYQEQLQRGPSRTQAERPTRNRRTHSCICR